MLGSHNTLSYLRPKKWRDWFTIPWSRCQEKDLGKQYLCGVRYFDIRLRIIKGEWHFVHNKIDYGPEDLFIYQCLSDFGEVYVRILLDQREKPKHSEECKELFMSHLNFLVNCYPGIHFDSAIVFWEWKEYLNPQIKVVENHFSVKPKKWWEYILGTRYFAWKVRKENQDEISDPSMVALKDFI